MRHAGVWTVSLYPSWVLSQLRAFQAPCSSACGITSGNCLAKALRKRPASCKTNECLCCWSDPLMGFGCADNKQSRHTALLALPCFKKPGEERHGGFGCLSTRCLSSGSTLGVLGICLLSEQSARGGGSRRMSLHQKAPGGQQNKSPVCHRAWGHFPVKVPGV